jgi:hypothetical protein
MSERVVSDAGVELTVHYDTDENDAETVEVEGLPDTDGRVAVTAPKGRPAVGFPWMVIGPDHLPLVFHVASVEDAPEPKPRARRQTEDVDRPVRSKS